MAIIEKTQRLLLIIRKIQTLNYLTLKQLTEEVSRELTARGYEPHCSRSNMQRDFEEIRTDFSIEIEYSRTKRGYFINNECSVDIESILEPFEILNSLNADGGVPDFVLAEKYRPLGTQHLFTLIDAIKKCFRINFEYTKYSGGTATLRTLEPYAIKQCRGRWYVVGLEPSSSVIKTFGLDRIDYLTVPPEKFRKDPTFDIKEKFKYSYGIYSSDSYPITDIILSFDAEDAGYLLSSPLHPTQEITEIVEDTIIEGIAVSNGEFVVRLRIRLTLDFVMEILSRSWSLRVISPVGLRDQINDIYKNALKRNQ